MYITNLEEIIDLLRPRLRDYLVTKKGIRANARKINCFVHSDSDPSMYFNHKNNNETVKCFSCGWSGDIFAAAEHIEGMPSSGPEWVATTIPHLAKMFDIPVNLGEPSVHDKERAGLLRLCQNIVDVGVSEKLDEDSDSWKYIAKRGWNQEELQLISVDEDQLMSRLVELGWSASDLNKSLLIRTKYNSYFGEKKITFVIKDHRGRPIGFISRDITDTSAAKYVNTPENAIYEKSKVLLGLDTAIQSAKKHGLYIVEGSGDLAHLYRLGITNAVAVCGTALTEQHLLLLKSLGIRKIFLSFDWDNAGHLATQRVLENVLKATTGISASVVLPPSESFENYSKMPKDPDEYLLGEKDSETYTGLVKQSAFEWQLAQASENDSPDVICSRMVPVIATEAAAVKREMLITQLAAFTGVSSQAISTDVNALRSDKFNERIKKLIVSAEQYTQSVTDDPDNIMAHVAQHEQHVDNIESCLLYTSDAADE